MEALCCQTYTTMIKYCKHLKDLDSIETVVSCCEKKICEAQISTVKRMKLTLDA